MTTSHDVFLATTNAYVAQRAAYIQLRGMDVILRRNQRGTARIDHYGDIINQASFTDSQIKMVFELTDYYRLMTNFESATNESILTPLECIVDLQLDIIAGDRVRFTHSLIQMINEDKEFVVGSVDTQIHVVPISKKINLVPLRDV